VVLLVKHCLVLCTLLVNLHILSLLVHMLVNLHRLIILTVQQMEAVCYQIIPGVSGHKRRIVEHTL
jgi:hypothetical protein